MDKVVLLDVVPSIMSAVAGVAAAVAAFVSLKISKQAKNIAEQSALAIQHNSAAIALSEAIDNLKESTKELFDLADEVFTEWAREIEKNDDKLDAGNDPRPLRHVLTNATEMLVTHAIESRKSYRHVHRLMYSIVRDGVLNLNDSEYEILLKKGDGTYLDFENTFGKPSIREIISESKAFRWAFYQLTKRVKALDWKDVWNKAWLNDGRLSTYEDKYNKVKPTIEAINKSLKSEKTKLAHTVLPLESNTSLSSIYADIISITESLIEDCNLEAVQPYRSCFFEPDFIELVVYSMGVVLLTTKVVDELYKFDFD